MFIIGTPNKEKLIILSLIINFSFSKNSDESQVKLVYLNRIQLLLSLP